MDDRRRDARPGAVHTEFNVCALEPGGIVATAVQSYEECFYVLEGTPIVQTAGGRDPVGCRATTGCCSLGVPHEWRNDAGAAPARWAQMRAPQPRAAYAP